MTSPTPVPTIVNVGYRSTNFWVVSAGTSRLLVDLGWPGTLGTLLAMLDRKGIPLAEIQYGLATHYHIDHAGLAQELKNRGVRLLVVDAQVSAIPLMKQWTKTADRYVDIALDDNIVVSAAGSRALLESIGIGGEIVHTPGHSADSVSLLLDTGAAFTGDLPPLTMVNSVESPEVLRSWRTLQARGATTVYGGHGPIRPMPAVT